MTAHEYQSGGWTALVSDGALALLHPAVPEDVARELWQLTTTGRRLGAWVEYLASTGIAALPSFAMVETHPDGLRVLVRGEVDVEIGGQVVSARGYATWREEVLPAATDVTIRAETADGGWLPVSGGIVRAAAARLAVDQEVPAAPLTEEDDDVELTVARMPALAAAVAGRHAATPVVAPADPEPVGVETAASPEPEQASPEPEPEPEPVGAETAASPESEPEPVRVETAASPEPEPADEPAPAGAEPAEEPVPEPALAATPATPAPLDSEEAEEAEESDDYDFLLWPTEQVQARASEAVAAAPEPPGNAEPSTTDAVTAETPAEQADSAHVAPELEATRLPEPEEDHDGETGGIIDSIPGRLRPPTAPPVSAWPPPPAPAAAPFGAPPPGEDGDHDGQTILTSEIPATNVPIALEQVERPPSELELTLSTGPRIEMDRPVLLGRAPEAARFVGTEVPRLVSVSNPERDISSTHVEIRPAGGHVVVTDLNSTNGTVVHLPEQPSFRLQPGTGVPVGAGAVIELGTGVTVTVTRVEGAR